MIKRLTSSALVPRRPKIAPRSRFASKHKAHNTKRSRGQKQPKLPSISKLKKELEKLQKQVVIKIYGRDCFTCPQKNLQGANCQLGHVPWPRSFLSTQCKFLYTYTRIQCYRCNIHMGGMGAVAFDRMFKEGINVIAMLGFNGSTKGETVPREWFLNKIQEYKGIVETKEGF